MAIPSQSHLPAEFSLTGHTAIVASAGGDETPFLAAALAEAGASVFAVARRQSAADAIADAVWRRLWTRHRTPRGTLGHARCGLRGCRCLRRRPSPSRHLGQRHPQLFRQTRRRD